MPEPWKNIICADPTCFFESIDETGRVREEFRIFPEIDTPELTQFTCPRCGRTEIWGDIRRQVAKTLYEKFQGA